MGEYIRWSWLQLYLLAFQPTRFRREVENERESVWTVRQRLAYLTKLLPWIVLIAVLGTLAAGAVCGADGFGFQWNLGWIGVAGGVALGVAGALELGVAFGVEFGVAYGVGIGVACGVLDGVTGSIAGGVTGGVVFGVTSGLAFGVAGGLEFSVARRVAFGVAVGLAFGVTFGVMFGTTFGVPSGIAVGVVSGVVGGVALGVTVGAGGVAGGIGRGVAGGIVRGAAGGIACGIAFGVTVSLAGGAARGLLVGVVVGIAFPLSFWVAYFRLFSYPLDVMMSYLAERWARRKPEAVRGAFRRCPVSWSEVIWLPLPFLQPLLVRLARDDRDEGLRRIAFVASERVLQRRAAIGALAELAIDDLGATSLDELAEVTRRLSWIADGPLDLPGTLASVLRRFDRIAHLAGQCLSVPNAYRKREALRRALDELDGLERTLIISPGRHTPALLTKAGTWRKLMGEGMRRLAADAGVSRELPNPFIFGGPLHERNRGVFVGRQDIVQAVERAILGTVQAPTLLLHGPRRMGKTSLLKQFPRLLGPDFAPAMVDCQLPSIRESPAAALQTLSEALVEALRRRHVRLDAVDPERLRQGAFAAYSDWLNAVERAMPTTLRAMLCLDEIEKLGEVAERGWGADLLDLLRHIAQHHPRIVLVFTGAHTFAELGAVWTDRFLGVRRMRVTYLAAQDVRPLLKPEIPGFDLSWAPEAIDALVAATCGQPFLTQAVAFELVQHMNERRARHAEPRDVEAAIERAFESGAEYFGYLWNDAGPDGRAMLTAAARERTRVGSPAANSRLRNQEVLNEEGRFVVPMVERWVREKCL